MNRTKNITSLLLGTLLALITLACAEDPEELCTSDLGRICFDNKIFECEERGGCPSSGGWGFSFRADVLTNCSESNAVCKEYEGSMATCIDTDMICPANTDSFCVGNNRYYCSSIGVSPQGACEDGFQCINGAEITESGLSVAKCEKIE